VPVKGKLGGEEVLNQHSKAKRIISLVIVIVLVLVMIATALLAAFA
jgi:flagellar basal body-associated protein FliL